MRNFQISFIFYDIADMLEIKGENFFKVRAYRRAAHAVESLAEEIEEVASQSRLREIDGIGEALSSKIEEIISTGTCDYYENLKKEVPRGLVHMLKIPGMGAKKIKVIHDSLGLTTISELEEAARARRLRNLPGIGVKTEKAIQKGIETYRGHDEKVLLSTALPIAERIMSMLSSMHEIDHIAIAGSVRRRREMVKDIDILVGTGSGEKIMKDFLEFPEIVEVLAKGSTKASVILDMGLQLDLRVVEPRCFYSALLHFTGSKEHNTKLRSLAIKQGYKLNEYGIFSKDDEEVFHPKSEVELYDKLGMPYIVPELREDRGEIEAALENRLPELVQGSDIRGDLHIHSNYSDGVNDIKTIAQVAKDMGYEYIAITDHSKTLKIAKGLDEKRLYEQMNFIDKLNGEIKGIRILSGAEVDILPDGSLDFNDDILKELDIVIASIHSGFRQDKDTITHRIISACENPYVNIIGHPTGRLLGRREPYDVDIDKVLETAANTGTILEINSSPDRLDLNDYTAKRAKEMGIKIAINTDTHHVDSLQDMQYGLWVARRGWLEKDNIINTLPLDRLLEVVRQQKK